MWCTLSMQYCYVFNCAKMTDKHHGGTFGLGTVQRVARSSAEWWYMTERERKLTELPITQPWCWMFITCVMAGENPVGDVTQPTGQYLHPPIKGLERKMKGYINFKKSGLRKHDFYIPSLYKPPNGQSSVCSFEQGMRVLCERVCECKWVSIWKSLCNLFIYLSHVPAPILFFCW